MRLRDRKHVTYNYTVTDDSADNNSPSSRRDLQDLADEPSDSDATCSRDVEKLQEQEDSLHDDKKRKVSGRPPRGRKRERELENLDLDSDSDRYRKRLRKTSFDQKPKPRSTRSARINYNEDSCSEASGKETGTESEEMQDEYSSDVSSTPSEPPKSLIGCGNTSNSNSFGFSEPSAFSEEGSEEPVNKDGSKSPLDKISIKFTDLGNVCKKTEGVSCHKDLKDVEFLASSGEVCGETECTSASVLEQSSNGSQDKPQVSSKGNNAFTEQTNQVQTLTMSDCDSDMYVEKTASVSVNIAKATHVEFSFFPRTYSRRSKQLQANSISGASEPRVFLPPPATNQECAVLELNVDKFGLYMGKNEAASVLKKVGQVEKIISVRNRHSDSAVYCVKLSGKSYRNSVYVHERLLAKNYTQLLRNFLKRMDELGRVDGNLGEKPDSPAFNPLYIRVDRIVAAEQRGRKKLYLVKWCGLPYSEATWEADDALASEKQALKWFSQINARGAPTSSMATFMDGRVLREYQKKGLAWINRNFQNKVNCILADEMGLGKTIQSVAMLQNLRAKWKIKGPFLVVAPVSTLGHWQREIESLTDMNCLVYAGNVEDKAIIKEYEFYSSGKNPELKFNVLLTGYEVLMKDHHFLAKHDWQYIIVDEAHRLKTKDSKTTRTLKEMSVKKGGLLLLTGTPVQNSTKEIFSLLNILDPDQFKSEGEFLAKYGNIQNIEQVRDLQENVLKPRLLRRMKEDVEKSIPLKEETIIWVELTHDQRSCYRAIFENRIADLLKGSQSSNIPNLRNVAMELRKLCNHPFLCDGLEEHLRSKSNQGSQADQGEEGQEASCKMLCQSSGKMLLMDKLLPKLKDAGRRVLIFSQFTIMLDLLEEYVHLKGYTYERIDGKIRGSERQAAIDRYSAQGSDSFVFLLSTRAGGLGITLTAADTCVIYDSDWNPQNDLQAMARCHRIGQTKDVKIYRLITRNTYEQHLFECSSRKYGLDEAILGNNLGSSADIEQSKNIESLLKRGAYDMLKDDGEAEATAFHAQNIEQILEQRTQKRLIGGRGNNTFSVATFISTPEDQSNEIDDPEKDAVFSMEPTEFWQELLPEACQVALSADRPQFVPSTGPRRRAEVNYKEKGEMSDEGTSEEEDKCKGRKPSVANRHNSRDTDMEDGVKQWSEKEFKRLEKRLIMLGKGREEQVMIEAELEYRGLSEVKEIANTLIQFCHYFMQKEANFAPRKEAETHTMKQHELFPFSPLSDSKLPFQAMHEPNLTMVEQKDGVLVADAEGMKNEWSECQFSKAMGVKQPEAITAAGGQHLKDNTVEGEQDVKAVSEVQPSQSFQSSTGKEVEAKKEIDCLQLPPFAKKVLTSQHCLMRLQKNASRYLQTLHERDVLSKALAESTFAPVAIPKSKKLPLWWGDVDDLNLMQGALKHGHKEFSKIREDPDLCFAAKLNAKRNVSNDQHQNMDSGEDQVVPDDWPHDFVLSMRLKKLIECLPNGLSDREIKRRAAAAEAARRRWMRQGQESIQESKNTQMGFIAYIDGRKYTQSELIFLPPERDLKGNLRTSQLSTITKDMTTQEVQATTNTASPPLTTSICAASLQGSFIQRLGIVVPDMDGIEHEQSVLRENIEDSESKRRDEAPAAEPIKRLKE